MAQFFMLPIEQWFDNSGNPLNAGTINFYSAGTTTAQDTFTDSTGATPNANPVVLDSAGRAQIWLSANSYKFVVKTSAGVTLLTVDNYNPTNVNTTVAQLTSTGVVTMQQSTAATSGANQSSNAFKIQGTYWDGAASQTDTWQLQDVLGTGSNPTSTLTLTHSGSTGTILSDISAIALKANAKNLNAIRFADQFTGASVGAQIDAAIADLGSAQGVVIIPSSMGAGNSLVGIPDNVRVLDFRGASGPNQLSQEAQTIAGQVLLRGRYTTDHSVGGGTVTTLQVHSEPAAGGQNAGTKTNWAASSITMPNRTPGQHIGSNVSLDNFSHGDAITFAGVATSWGYNSAAGDEGCEGISIQAKQGTTVMTGTVTSNTSGVLALSPITNGDTMGEGRPVIITTASKIYSTGSVSGISGTPPTVTGSGTAWATQFGSGAKTNLFFVMDADIVSGVKLCVPIRSITNDTTLILDYKSEGVDSSYPGTTSGTYKIYKGGTSTAVAEGLASITVSPNSDFAATDTVEQTIGYALGIAGVHIGVSPAIASPANTGSIGLSVTNSGAVTATSGISMAGNFQNAINITGSSTVNGIAIQGAVGTSGVGPLINYTDTTNNSVVKLIKVFNNSSVERDFFYDRANDAFKFNVPAAPSSAGGTDLGKAALPWANAYIGAAATNNIKLTGTATAARTVTLSDVTGTVNVTVATDDKTAQSATVGPITLVTGDATTGGRYWLEAVIQCTTGDASGASVILSFTHTSDGISLTDNTGSLALSSSTNASQRAQVCANVDASTNITYTATVTGTPSTAKFSIHVWVVKQ